MRKIPLLLSCLFSAILVAPVYAESADPERGRLPDGRAFRTDDEGNQLVDYIAELELEKEGLEGRIFNLQDKIRQQATQVASKPEPVACPACVQRECPAIECPKPQPVSCPQVQQATVVCPTCVDREDEIHDLQRKVSRLSSDNAETESERASLVEELGTCQTKSEQFETTAASLQESLGDMRKALADRDSSLQQARNQVAELRQEKQQLIAAREGVNLNDARASMGATAVASRGSALSNSALSAARAQLLARVAELKSQVRARDEQFLRIDQRGKSLQVRPAKLVTRSGFELKNAEASINGAANFRAISDISRELEALSRMISDDIRLGAKLSKR